MATLSTLAGWAAIIAVGGLYYYLTKEKAIQRGRRLTVTKQPLKPIESRKDPKAKKLRKDTTEGAKLGEKGPKPKSSHSIEPDSKISSAKPNRVVDDEEVSNREFARQLANAKTGTLLTAKTEVGARQKSVKQSKAQEKETPVAFETSPERATASSSATGGDADDDQSSTNSSELDAAAIGTPVPASGISDMLEAPAPGPSVLRITEPTNPARPKKAKAQPAFEAVETKKQRQNRKKAEAKKLDRDAEERDRKVLMEKQRRLARESEGRAAKDGSQFMASLAPSSSAWSEDKPTNDDKTPETSLLDTFEPQAAAPKPPAETIYSESELAGSDWQKVPLSEEEQLRFVVEDSKNWETVKTKEKKKKERQPNAGETSEEKKEKSEYSVPAVTERLEPGNKWNAIPAPLEDSGPAAEHEKELQDSEWEVA